MQDIIQLDPEYKNLIQQLKEKVVSSRMRAMLAVNAEQIKLYWEIGKTILERQKISKWGTKLLEQVSVDLREYFPNMKGFSRSNIHYMKQFAELHPNAAIVQQPVGQLPWGHIIVLIKKIKDDIVRQWYAMQAIDQGWSRERLLKMIKQDLYARKGIKKHKLANFETKLPDPQSGLALIILFKIQRILVFCQ